MKKIQIFKSLNTRGVRYGGYSALVSFAVIVGLIILNLIVGQLKLEADMTSGQIFSLSQQSRDVLDGLEDETTIYVLHEEGSAPEQIMAILKKYDNASKMIKIQSIDPEQNPAMVERFAQEEKELGLGTVIVANARNFKIIPYYDMLVRQSQSGQVIGLTVEKRVTNALLYTSSGFTPIVYELTGHNEYKMSDFQNLSGELEKENLQVKELNLVQSRGVPEDAAAVLIWAPETDLNPQEAEKIEEYLDNHGKLYLMVDLSAGETSNLNAVLEPYGVQFKRGVVIEKNQNYHTGRELDLVPDMADHEILEPLKEAGFPVMTPRAQAVITTEMKRRDVEITPLLTTSPQSFLRTDLEEPGMNKVPSDISGPHTVAAAVRVRPVDNIEDPTARIILVGSTEMLVPNYLYGVIPGNINFFMNSLSWLQDRRDNITIRSKSVLQFPMSLTGTLIIVYSVIFVIVLPLASFVTGLVVWLRRRHR